MGRRTTAEDRPQAAIAFGSYRFLPRKRLLLRGNDEVRLGSRALAILGILLERAGEIVPSAEIISRVWPDTRVESAALKVHIGLLRKALGEVREQPEFISNIAGRGYRFAAPVHLLVDRNVNAAEDVTDVAAPRTNRVVGRQYALEQILSLLGREGLVTISGTAGMGKTTIARLIADRSRKTGLPTYFVDLAPLSDSASVVGALASTFGLPARRHQRSEIAIFLSDQHALLVLDSCEHVLTEVTHLASELLRRAPNIRILATSRERLQVRGEYVYQLGALDLPPPADSLSAKVALTFSAIQLFVDRASSVIDTFVLSDANVRIVVEICRRLDGIPLAIELAAGQVGMFGLTEIARGLNNSLEALTVAKRTSTGRHRTLGEALDWSYRLLSPVECTVLHCLSIFPGKFDHFAAIAVCSQGELGDEAVVASLASLVKKSMIFVDDDDGRFRLLETTRAHAKAKLNDCERFRHVAKLHAAYCCNLFADAEYNWEERASDEWLTKYGKHIDDVRSALAWAFSDKGDGDLGTELAASSAALWFQLSLLDEYIGWAERAIAVSSRSVNPNKRQQLQLAVALALALMRAKVPGRKVAEAFERTLTLSNELGLADQRVLAYWGLCTNKSMSGDYSGALILAEEYLDLYGDSESVSSHLTIKRAKAVALESLGSHRSAHQLIEELVAQPVKAVRRLDGAFSFDGSVNATAMLASNLWLQGFVSRAIQVAGESLEAALSIDHVPSLCVSLSIAACPIAIHVGDVGDASKFTQLLLARSQEHHLEHWNLYGKGYELVLAHRKGATVGLTDAPYLYMETSRAGPIREMFGTLCPGICDPRLFSEAEQQSGWCRPELLRVKGELLRGGLDVAAQRAAESIFLLSLKLARENGALSWEIRTAVSLAELWKTDRRLEARNVIEDVLGRFVDPYQTTDMCAAQRLYDDLR